MATRRRHAADNRRPVTPQAVDYARLAEEAERRTRETTALLEVSRVVASSLDLSEVLGAILDQLGAITEHTGASILLIRDDVFEFVAARSITGSRAQIGARLPYTAGSGIAAARRYRARTANCSARSTSTQSFRRWSTLRSTCSARTRAWCRPGMSTRR